MTFSIEFRGVVTVLLTTVLLPAAAPLAAQTSSTQTSAAQSPTAQSPAAQSSAAPRYDVRIRRDSFGVPHILGRTDADAAYGLAYAHAEDDFATIQGTLMAARGQRAMLEGKDGVAGDTLFQLLDIPAVLRDRYATDLPAPLRRILDAYAAGINDYAAAHPGAAARSFAPVTGQDIAALQLLRGPSFYGLDTVIGELAAGKLPEDNGTGSNAVAVAPSRSADRHTRLLFNAHQPFTGAFSWWEAVVESKAGWHVAGGFFPGTPFLLGGHNEHLSWAATTNRPDLVDVYRLTVNPANPDEYRLDGKWLPFDKRSVEIKVRQPDGTMATVRRELLRSRHGPVIRNALGLFAVRYPTFGGARQLLQYYRMNIARNLKEWQAAMELRGLPNINYVYADGRGNIGFVANGLYPLRKDGFDWKGVVPGDRSDLIWTTLRPWNQVPQIWNPRSGYVFNSNNTPFVASDPKDDVVRARYPASMGLQTDMTNRAWRALETYGADTSITAQDFDAYKYDIAYSRRSDTQDIVTAILAADARDMPDLAAAQGLVRQWNYRADLDNRSMAIVGLTWLNMRRTHRAALPAALDVIKELKSKFGRLDPRWGEVNRLRRGPLDLAVDGGPDAFRAIYGRADPDGRYRAFNGDGYTMFVDWDTAGHVISRSIHQFGAATLDATSPHYADQSAMFVAHRTKPVLFTEAELKGHVERDYRPGGAK